MKHVITPTKRYAARSLLIVFGFALMIVSAYGLFFSLKPDTSRIDAGKNSRELMLEGREKLIKAAEERQRRNADALLSPEKKQAQKQEVAKQQETILAAARTLSERPRDAEEVAKQHESILKVLQASGGR